MPAFTLAGEAFLQRRRLCALMAFGRVLSIVTGLSGKLSQVGTIGVSLGQLQRCVRLAADLAASLAAKMVAKMAAHLAAHLAVNLAAHLAANLAAFVTSDQRSIMI